MNENLLKELVQIREEFMTIFKQTPEDLKIGEWGKKEILAHIVGWEEEAVRAIPQILQKEKPRSLKISMDTFNKENVLKHKNKTIDQLLEELSQYRSGLLSLLSEMKSSQFEKPVVAHINKKPVNIQWIVSEIIEHDKNHTKELKAKNSMV